MTRKTRPFSDLRQEQLLIAEVASEYLNLAKAQSQEVFLKALRRVAQARQMARVAKEANIQRETLYHALSEIGNPTLLTLTSVLDVLELDFIIKPKRGTTVPVTPHDLNAFRLSNLISGSGVSNPAGFTGSAGLWITGGFQSTAMNTYSPRSVPDAISRTLGASYFEIDTRPLGALRTSLPRNEQQQLMGEVNVAA